MKAVLMSVKPKWWEKILSGEKTMEIRKSAPQDKGGRVFRWPLTVLVYVSGTGAVQGQFTCTGWARTGAPDTCVDKILWDTLVERSGVKLEDLRAYAKGGNLYGWVVKNPHKYDTPSPLAEFGLNHPPMSWQYVEIQDGAAEV